MAIEPAQRINNVPVVRKDKTDQEKPRKPKDKKKDDGEKKGKIDIRV